MGTLVHHPENIIHSQAISDSSRNEHTEKPETQRREAVKGGLERSFSEI